MENAVITYTHNDLEHITSKGHDNSWKLNQKRAGSCKYLVCCHSQGANKRNAFLVGLISKVELFEEERYAIYISEYASINVSNTWKGWQNPVHYTSLEDLGIDISTLKFEKIQKINEQTITEIPPLSIEQAKEGLAKKFGISSEQIEIVVKG